MNAWQLPVTMAHGKVAPASHPPRRDFHFPSVLKHGKESAFVHTQQNVHVMHFSKDT